MQSLRTTLAACLAIILSAVIARADEPSPNLARDLAALSQLPAWMRDTQVSYDLSNPWKKARLEVRRLLGENKLREGMKLTWLYKEKGDIGNGHEWPMYLFMGGELAWCIKVYRERIPKLEAVEGPVETVAYLQLSACYRHYGELDRAIAVLQRGMGRLPAKPWTEMRRADVHARLGDLYVLKKQYDQAKSHFAQAVAELKKARPPYGRHLIPRKIANIQARSDMIDLETLDLSTIRDGVYRATMPGYTKPLTVNVHVKAGRITDVKVQHSDKITLHSTEIVPRRIVEQQSVTVDGVTGATVTSQAIMTGTFEALRNAPRR